MKFAAVTPLCLVIVLSTIITEIYARAAENGKYNKQKYSHGNHGKYYHTNEGDYVEDVDRYRYVHYDDGDRGRYRHIHVPYDGGYGNYEGGHEPFRNPPYDASGLYAYVQKPRNESCLRLLEQYSNTCSDSGPNDPFRVTEYDIRKPDVYVEYGTPYPEFNYGASSNQEKKTSAGGTGGDPRISTFPGVEYLPAARTSPHNYQSSGTVQHQKVATISDADITTILLTTASGQESKLDPVTKAPDDTPPISITISKKFTSQPAATPSPATAAATAPVSIEQQLYHCRAELKAALLKLSRN